MVSIVRHATDYAALKVRQFMLPVLRLGVKVVFFFLLLNTYFTSIEGKLCGSVLDSDVAKSKLNPRFPWP